MARMFVSPMGDPTFANAAASLAEALFPSAASQARAKMMGAQYQGQLASNEQTNLENVGLRRSNDAYASMGDVITDPMVLKILQADNSRNANTLSDALGNFQEQGLRGEAVRRADAAGYGVNAPLIGLSNGPIKVNDIVDGYAMNQYLPGSGREATSKTIAEIGAINNLAFQRGTAGNLNQANIALVNDKRQNPQRYRADGKSGGLSVNEAATLDKLIDRFVPQGVTGPDGKTVAAAFGDANLRNDISFRASDLINAGMDPMNAVKQAVTELTDVTPGIPYQAPQDNWDLWGLGTPDVPEQQAVAPVVKRRQAAPRIEPVQGPPPPPAAGKKVGNSPYPEGTQLNGPGGKYVVRNGVPVKVE